MLAPKLTLFESAGAVGAQRRQLDEHLPLTSSTHLVHPLTQLRKKLPLCNNARYQIWYTPSGASPSCCETTPATGPVTLCSRTGQSEGPEESRVRKLRPMIEADAPSTSSLATHRGVVLCPPHRSSHGRTAGDSVQRFKDAKLRPRQGGEVPKCARSE